VVQHFLFAMNSFWKKCVLLVAPVAGVVVFISVIYTVSLSSKRTDGRVIMTYEGLNETGQFCIFTVHNDSGRRILCECKVVEVQTPSGWVTNRILQQTATGLLPFTSSIRLPAGAQGALLVPPQPTNEIWRIRISCFEKATGWRGLLFEVRKFCFNVASTLGNGGGWQESWNGRHFQITSPQVNP
jgi:hypothetical protein